MEFISVLRLYFLCIIFGLCGRRVISRYPEENRVVDYGGIYNSLNGHTKSNFLYYKYPKVDFLREDDVEELELGDIISLSRANVGESIDAYTSLDKMTIVDIHNMYRLNLTKPIPEGANVMYVQWNNTLASAAEEWLKECQLAQGFGENDNFTKERGQNMYQGPSMIPSRPLYLWYEEYKNYFFHNFSCKKPYPKHQCGHVTQLLWFDSALIGCARRSYCFPQDTSFRLVNCYYYRRGNLAIPGMQVFKYGYQCTKCDLPDGNLCYRGLCISKETCSKHELDCECKLNCKNCVKPNYKTCRCDPCKDGWDWPDCSYPCFDAYDYAREKPGFCKWQGKILTKEAACKNKDVLTACRKECGACKPLNLNLVREEDVCCRGKKCPPHYVLDETCNCTIDCPSNLCLFPSPKTAGNPINSSSPDEKKREKNFPKRKEVNIPSRSISLTESTLNLIFVTLSTLILRT